MMPIEWWPTIGFEMLNVNDLFDQWMSGYQCSHCGRKCRTKPGAALKRISDGKVFLMPIGHYWKCYYQPVQREKLFA